MIHAHLIIEAPAVHVMGNVTIRFLNVLRI